MKIVLSLKLFFIGIVVFGQTSFQSQKLEDFAKLYGVVRYFHPSDEAAKIDWKGFAVYSVKEIEKARNQEEFEQKLKDLFLTIAPTISFSGDNYKWDETSKYPVFWEHKGLGIDGQKKTYYSQRYNRTSKDKSFKAISLNIEDSILIGKKIKLIYEAKTSEGNAYCYLKIVGKNRKNLGFVTHQYEPVISPTWQSKELIIDANNNIRQLNVGLITDDGNSDFRNLKLFVEETNSKWTEVPFTSTDNNKWLSMNNAKFSIKNDEISIFFHENETVLLNTNATINCDKYYTVNLSNGVNVVVPMVVFSDDKGTNPKGDKNRFNDLKNSIYSINKKQFTQETSIANLIVIWNIFKHFFPYQNEVKVEWDTVLLNGIKDAYDDNDENQHRLTLERFTENFKDAHINIISDKTDLSANAYSTAASLRWVGEKLVVKDMFNGYDGKLKKGDIIKEINNKPISFVLDSISQYISGSKQWKKWVALRRINRGSENSTLILKNENETIFKLKRTLNIKENKDFFEREGKTAYEEINKDIFYINSEKLTPKIIDSLVPTINKHKGLIIDLRGYPYNDLQHRILSYTKVVDSTAWLCPTKIFAPNYSKTEEVCSGHRLNNYKADSVLTTKNVLIVDERTISNAEMLAQVMKHYKIATIVGHPTAGANGNINTIKLLDGFQVLFTGMKVKNPDGSQFHSIGVIPDVIVEETVDDVLQGKDAFIEKAIEVLNKEI